MASSNRSNRVEVPEAKAAMDRFKTEVASELGVNLKEGYNGDLTSREAGSIGGEMVRRMIKKQEEQMKEVPQQEHWMLPFARIHMLKSSPPQEKSFRRQKSPAAQTAGLSMFPNR